MCSPNEVPKMALLPTHRGEIIATVQCGCHRSGVRDPDAFKGGAAQPPIFAPRYQLTICRRASSSIWMALGGGIEWVRPACM